ncbi:MAG: response regulator [Kangiellaceae bacterium]|nr:response regulator [Kangiellaceae bacterium]
MTNKIDILAIDDDKFVQKMIARALDSESTLVRTADSGEQGLELAKNKVPDIILLDVEMPGINGYVTCERLRGTVETCQVPIIFLSGRSSLRERMQGYEVGGDDYLVKPFENENLKARVEVLFNYNAERQSLQHQYQIAQKTAVDAITGTSELGQAIQFLEKSIAFQSTDELIGSLLSSLEQFGLDCCAMTESKENVSWFAVKGAISPIEKELIEMSDKEKRFLDFGQRTIVNFPLVRLLARNMPLDNHEKYGRLKDLLPIYLSAVNVKLSSIETQSALNRQSEDMLNSFKSIRRYLYHMGTTIVSSREEGKVITSELLQELQSDLLTMGLEQDQEDYLLDRIDTVVNDVMLKLDAGCEIRSVLSFILSSLKSLIDKQENILDEFNKSIVQNTDVIQADDNIELF